MEVVTIDQISEVPSEIYYIKRFIGRVILNLNSGSTEFFIGFSLEKRPVGPPDVALKFIDAAEDEVKSEQQKIVDKILEMEKSGVLKHTPFEGL